mmetsp:Transcript_17484/g.40645  ORF Transcript_17484/g.40645 Transcript_17484/m.40645 type:complete len:112 (-) Transcript_17484:46-381(-)
MPLLCDCKNSRASRQTQPRTDGPIICMRWSGKSQQRPPTPTSHPEHKRQDQDTIETQERYQLMKKVMPVLGVEFGVAAKIRFSKFQDDASLGSKKHKQPVVHLSGVCCRIL